MFTNAFVQPQQFTATWSRLAQEQLGQKQRAVEFYRQAFATTGHNPPAAFAKPFARAKLAQK